MLFEVEAQSNIWQQETDNTRLASTNNMSNSEMALLRFWWQFTPTQAPTYLERTLMATHGHPSFGLESQWPCSSSCDCMNETKALYERSSSYVQMILLSQCHMLSLFLVKNVLTCCPSSDDAACCIWRFENVPGLRLGLTSHKAWYQKIKQHRGWKKDISSPRKIRQLPPMRALINIAILF